MYIMTSMDLPMHLVENSLWMSSYIFGTLINCSIAPDRKPLQVNPSKEATNITPLSKWFHYRGRQCSNTTSSYHQHHQF